MKYLEINGKKRLVTPLLMKPFLVSQSIKGLKTQTRRDKGLEEINENPDQWKLWDIEGRTSHFRSFKANGVHHRSAICPFGKIGDILWVRETFKIVGPVGCDWRNKPAEFVLYAADILEDRLSRLKPNIHMPASLCRHFLEIVEVYPVRLYDMDKSDAIAEGIEQIGPSNSSDYKNYLSEKMEKKLQKGNVDLEHWTYSEYLTPMVSFHTLWISINGKESYQLNPWLWRIKYKAIPKPEGFDALFSSKPKRKPLKSAV